MSNAETTSSSTTAANGTAPSAATAESVTGWLVETIAGYREVPPADIDTEVPLAELGLDSVYVLSLCGDIEDRWGLAVEPTIAWDHPTVDALAAHLHGELVAEGS